MDLVTASIVKRYNGPLERQGMGCQGDIFTRLSTSIKSASFWQRFGARFLKGDTLENALLIIDEVRLHGLAARL